MALHFDRMKNGYNRYQVDSAIEELNMRVENLQRIKEAYQLRCVQLEEQLRSMEKVYDPAIRNLRQKEDAAGQMVAIAMKEANTIVATARQNADVIVREALLDARLLLADITRLAAQTKDAKGEMQRQTKRISRLLDSFEPIVVPSVELLEKEKKA